jgi:3-isopropylmalate/(R)-2-methylmalate dehydratase small subunit
VSITGKSVKLGDNIKFAITDMRQLAKHIMEDIDPNFAQKIVSGESIIVAGNNFGMGSSREQAPLVIKEAGIVAVLSSQFARIFFRNGFNIGLPLIETDTSKINEGDQLQIDLAKGLVRNLTRKIDLEIKPLPKFMQDLLTEGGIINYYKKYGELKL